MLPLYLHVNQKSNDDDDDEPIKDWINSSMLYTGSPFLILGMLGYMMIFTKEKWLNYLQTVETLIGQHSVVSDMGLHCLPVTHLGGLWSSMG